MTEKRLIHIVDDEDAVRRSAGFMLRTSGFDVEAWSSGIDFLRQIRHRPEGCVLLDVRMPEISGLEVQAALTEQGLTLPVIVLTGHGDISIAVRAMKAGAVDFIEKPFEKAVLLAAIENGFRRLERAETAASRAAEAEILLGALTPREVEVLDMLAQGLPNKTIGYDLDISPRTVEVHRAHLMSKLKARSLSDVLRIAFAAGLGGKG